MSIYIQGISTLVPETHYSQEYILNFMLEHVSEDRLSRLLLRRIYHQSGIEKRHTVIEGLDGAPCDCPFFEEKEGKICIPGSEKRNDLYIRKSKEMFPELARQTIAGSPGYRPEDITHVITISCTGFYAPGPDLDIVKSLGLPLSTQRYHLGFMGCYAAFPALRMAAAFCETDPEAVVLIATLELCSLHVKFRKEPDFLLAETLFADGGAGVLVSARRPQNPERSFQINMLSSDLAPEGEKDMTWSIGDYGFNMKLSSYIPDLLQANIANVVNPFLFKTGLDFDEITYWAIHPGGRAIIDKVENELKLPEDKVVSSRTVLRNYGNMSSATILFVLKDILEQSSVTINENVYAIAFGPGLTIESGLFIKNPVPENAGAFEKIPAGEKAGYA